MRQVSAALVVTFLVLIAVSAGAVGTVSADHGESFDEDDVVEIQTVSGAETERGELEATYRYHIGETAEGLRVRFLSGEEPTSVTGFEPTDEEDTYEWDGTTHEPTFTFTIDANQSDPRHHGLQTVDTGDWAIIGLNQLPRTGLSAIALESELDDIDTEWITTVPDGEGIVADGFVYLGEYEQYSSGAGIDLVVAESATSPSDEVITDIPDHLDGAASQLRVGATGNVTAFVVTDPLRRGGVSIGNDFWIHDGNLPPDPVLWHEYVHTRQQYEAGTDVEWTIEGGADYYSYLLALKGGELEYHEFASRLERGWEHEDVVLADRESWLGTNADYELGALTIAAMDESIRAKSDGSFEDVFREKNHQYDEQTLSDERFATLTSEVAGTEMGEFFDEHVRSTPPAMAVPSPLVYDGPNDAGTLSVRSSDVATDTAESAAVALEIQNTGSELSLAPTVVSDPEPDATVTVRSVDRTELTELEDSWVLDHVGPGDTASITFEVTTDVEPSTIDFHVEDMSGNTANATHSLEQREPLEITLETPQEIRAGKRTELVTDTTAAPAELSGYSVTVSGPGDEDVFESEDGTIPYTFETAGTYFVSVSVETVDGRTATATADVVVSEPDSDGEGEDSTTGEPDDDTEAGEKPGENVEEDSDAFAPGFGLIAAFGALVVLAGLLSVRRSVLHTSR